VRNAARIAAGGWYSYGIDSQGRVYAWGNNSGGQLGLAGPYDSYVPKRVIDPQDPGATRGARAMTEYLNDRIGQGHYFITSSFQEAQGIDAGAAGAGCVALVVLTLGPLDCPQAVRLRATARAGKRRRWGMAFPLELWT